MKFVRLIAAAILLAFMLPLMLLMVFTSSAGLSPSDKALKDIPHDLIPLYENAAATCPGLDWTILAAIHKVETGFGTGPATSSKGAQGPMQFLASTFTHYGVDGDGDERIEIDDVEDAIFSAANLLCANGAGDPARLASAVWNYNHSQSYVDEVLNLAVSYGVVGVPDGIAFAASSDLLHNERIILTPFARADLQAGAVDQRVVSLLAWIAQRHTITVGVLRTGHSKYTRSGSVSNHYYGRAADISFVDGEPVNARNTAALQLVLEIAGVVGDLRPSELGHPFGVIRFPGAFSDADHAGHLHLGFDA